MTPPDIVDELREWDAAQGEFNPAPDHLLRRAAAEIERLRGAGWVAVMIGNRLPPFGERVQVWSAGELVSVAMRSEGWGGKDHWVQDDGRGRAAPTHWRPLPQPPEGK